MHRNARPTFTYEQTLFVGKAIDGSMLELRAGRDACELGVTSGNGKLVVARIAPSKAASLAGALMDYVRMTRDYSSTELGGEARVGKAGNGTLRIAKRK